MSDPTFAQPERRNFLVPGLIVAGVVAIAAALVVVLLPYRTAQVTVTHTAILPTHTAFDNGSRVVGAQNESQNDLYVLATVHVDNRLRIPMFIKDITGAFTTSDGAETTSSAVEKNDLGSVYVAFPALKPLAGPPLLRESTIQPRGSAEGMVLLDFPVTEAEWKQRKSATVTLEFYHQDPITVTIPQS